MLEDVAKIRRVVLATGYVDLRKGIDGLAQIIGANYGQNPFEEGIDGNISSSDVDNLLPWSDSLPDKCHKVHR